MIINYAYKLIYYTRVFKDVCLRMWCLIMIVL